MYLTGCGDRTLDLQAPLTMQMESTAFKSEDLIPAKYTCDGDNISPPLSWSEPPAQTRSFVLILSDPDAPGRTFIHWILYDLPPHIRQLPENLPKQPLLTEGGVHSKSDFGQYGYGGPCPPGGTHRYFFRLYALDMLLNLAPGTAKNEVFTTMKDHILAGAELMGRYSRP
jgi:hypothetical protein